MTPKINLWHIINGVQTITVKQTWLLICLFQFLWDIIKICCKKYAPFDIHFLSVIRNMALIFSFCRIIRLYREWLLRNTLCYKFHQCTFGVAFDVQNSLSLLLFLQNFLFLSFFNNANRQGKCLHHLWGNYRHGYSNMKAPE